MPSKQEKSEAIRQLDERTSARGLLNYAVDYYAGYELIQNSEPDFIKLFAVKYYLLCHSLELIMKAWLKKKGATYFEIKKLGHNLEDIMAVLHSKHNLIFDASSQAMIRLVNQHYSNKEFEYSLRGSKTVPVISDLADTVRLLISKAKFDILLDGDPRKLREVTSAGD
ncbi:hypothetical protein IT414_01180 [bacterium]|nr:hypothetical protein [bacterium]